MATTRVWMIRSVLVAALSLFAVGSIAASEGDVPLVDGSMWKATAKPLKRSYIIGIANFLSVEYAYQKKQGFPDDDSTVKLVYEGIDDLTLDGAIQRIDGWYDKNPNKLATTVLEVIWLDMVEPNLK